MSAAITTMLAGYAVMLLLAVGVMIADQAPRPGDGDWALAPKRLTFSYALSRTVRFAWASIGLCALLGLLTGVGYLLEAQLSPVTTQWNILWLGYAGKSLLWFIRLAVLQGAAYAWWNRAPRPWRVAFGMCRRHAWGLAQAGGLVASVSATFGLVNWAVAARWGLGLTSAAIAWLSLLTLVGCVLIPMYQLAVAGIVWRGSTSWQGVASDVFDVFEGQGRRLVAFFILSTVCVAAPGVISVCCSQALHWTYPQGAVRACADMSNDTTMAVYCAWMLVRYEAARALVKNGEGQEAGAE